MKILSIETSADETAVSLVHATGEFPSATYDVLGNAIRTQIEMHREYGGIFPAMAKREHAKALVPLLSLAVEESGLEDDYLPELTADQAAAIQHMLEREPELAEALLAYQAGRGKLPIDLIAVTSGPGLEPTLWVGVNFARALAYLWNVPIVPINHMEGHLLASIYDVEEDDQLAALSFPTISLLISGGHTELILMRDWGQYEKIGQTRDDAVGEAFDKVARMLGLPYPGGPEVGARASLARRKNLPPYGDPLPTPMLNSGDLDFSFSGLKTAVRYKIQDKELSEDDIAAVCRDFEDVVTTVLLKKTEQAVEAHNAQAVIVGGGVSASPHLRQAFYAHFLHTHPDTTVYFPAPGLSTDNSLMIALAGHARAASALSPKASQSLRANGNRSLSTD